MSSVIWRERNQKRIEKIGATIILGAAGLFALFALYFFLAPWEVAYRQQGVATMRTQFDALPILSTDRQLDVSSNSTDRIDVFGHYSRRGACETVLNHYREVAPIQGWTFVWRQSIGDGDLDHYSGVFGGYSMDLTVACDTTGQEYSVDATVLFPNDMAIYHWIFG